LKLDFLRKQKYKPVSKLKAILSTALATVFFGSRRKGTEHDEEIMNSLPPLVNC